jgi:tetratricopeptide (TPR) repeat protein
VSGPRRRRSGPRGRPQRWQWVLTATVAFGSVAGGIASNILADLVNQNLGAVTWVVAGAAALIAGVLAVLEVRSRRFHEGDGGTDAAEPRPLLEGHAAGVPTDLPYTSGFIGRRAIVDWAVDAMRTERAVALVGRRAVGTSACVVQAANTVRARYPDGQLYLDLRQADRSLRPREVVDALCRKLDIDEATLRQARDVDAAAALLRVQLGDRRVLLVLDNVSSQDQIRALLTPAAHCRLLMAGTTALAGLDGLRVRRLTEPPVDEAAELFAAAARDAGAIRRDLRSDPDVRELVELAGRQPYAVRVLGSRMAANGWSPAGMLIALRRALARPARTDPTLALLAARDGAYAALGRGAQRLFRLLALTRQPLSRNAIAALCGKNRRRTDRMLAELVAGAFATATPDGRYRLRPLLVGYAQIHLCRSEPPGRQVAAQGRLVRYLARQAERFAAELADPAATGGIATPSGGAAGATELLGTGWFTRHGALLHTIACDTWGSPGALPADPPRRVRRWWLRLAMALSTWYAAHGRRTDWAAVCRAVLDSPVAERRAAVAGWAHNELGAVYRWQGQPHDAAVELTKAVALRHRRGAAQSRTNLGLALLDQDDVIGALDQLHRARRQRSPSDRAGQALTDLGLGAAFLARHEPLKARHHLIQAANRFDTIGDRRGYAAALTNLSLAQWWLGERLDAAHAWSAAIDCYAATTDRFGHASALLNAGAVVLSSDRRRAGQARELLLESLRMHQATGRPLGRTLLYLGDAAAALDDPAEARRRWAEAAEACHEAGDVDGEKAARDRLSS